MLNVEIRSVLTGRETSMRAEIFEALNEMSPGDAGEATVTIERTPTSTENVVGSQQPFLIVSSSNGAKATIVADMLAIRLHIDVWVNKLDNFVPAGD